MRPMKGYVRLVADFQDAFLNVMEERGIRSYADALKDAGFTANNRSQFYWFGNALHREARKGAPSMRVEYVAKLEAWAGRSFTNPNQGEPGRLERPIKTLASIQHGPREDIWLEIIPTPGHIEIQLVRKNGDVLTFGQPVEANSHWAIGDVMQTAMQWGEVLNLRVDNLTKYRWRSERHEQGAADSVGSSNTGV
jgi:hypothetical protein